MCCNGAAVFVCTLLLLFVCLFVCLFVVVAVKVRSEVTYVPTHLLSPMTPKWNLFGFIAVLDRMRTIVLRPFFSDSGAERRRDFDPRRKGFGLTTCC